MTPASSEGWQLWTPTPRWEQLASLDSEPLHWTLSKWMIPTPGPNWAECVAAAPESIIEQYSITDCNYTGIFMCHAGSIINVCVYLCHQTPTVCKQLQHLFHPRGHHTLSPIFHWSTPLLCHLRVIFDQQDEYHHLNKNLQCCKDNLNLFLFQFCCSSTHLGTQPLHPHNDSSCGMQHLGVDSQPAWIHFPYRTHHQEKWVHHLAQMMQNPEQWLLKMKPTSYLVFNKDNRVTYLLNWAQVVYRQQLHLYYPKSHHTLCPIFPHNRSPPCHMFHSLKPYHQPALRLCHCIQQNVLRVETTPWKLSTCIALMYTCGNVGM